MKIEDAINQLIEEKNNGTKSIVFAYWTSEMFDKEDDENWLNDSESVEQDMDWSNTHNQIDSLLESYELEYN